MKFSICIPNYNYERYLGRTIRSVLDQGDPDFEIVVADNASTDSSVALVQGVGDPRIKVRINACNVGFSGNLDRVGRMATGDVMLMLSSDDLMRPTALARYRQFYDAMGAERDRTVVSSAADVIDADDATTGRIPPDAELWTQSDLCDPLPGLPDAKVYRVDGYELLRRCLRSRKNPFNFLATAYPRALYERLEGYGGGRLINPDKWFHWRLLGSGCTAYFIDATLFAYRWHANNQAALQASSGALKLPVDEYVSTIELDAKVLERLGITRDEAEQAFIEHNIVRHALATLARGQRVQARRILDFGRAVYPRVVRRNRKAWILSGLLSLGPVGGRIARRAYESYSRKNQLVRYE